jgi:hypothetical protein
MPLPFSEQIMLDLVVPPVGAAIWWLMARGWAGAVQGNTLSQRTKVRQKWEFWILLFVAYLLMFGITAYGCLKRPEF